MEAIIHPGMHKTGSSSIQATLMALKPEGWVGPPGKRGNMTSIMASLFEEKPLEFKGFQVNGINEKKLEQVRLENFRLLDESLRYGIENNCKSIFTSEYISSASKESVINLANFYRERGYEPRVVAYVRKPLSFMQSAFQQRLKGNLNQLDFRSVPWADYRRRFEKFDEIFGENNVELSVFEKDCLIENDVCVDFFRKIGININKSDVTRVNESMSLPACALLFAQRNQGMGFVQGFDRAQSKNNQFVKSIKKIPGEPLRFKREFAEAVFQHNLEDIEWMEERLGQPLSDLPDKDGPSAIGSTEDLLEVADEYRDVLEELLIAEIQKEGDQPRDRLIRNLELLRKLHY